MKKSITNIGILGDAPLDIITDAKVFLLAGITLAFVNGAAAQNEHPAATEGQMLYEDFGCFQCHGFEGQGSQASPPVPRIAPTQYPLDAFSVLVRTPPRIMPAYSSAVLSDTQLQAIYEYMRSIPEPPTVEEIPVLRNLR
jgi:mono/diheme cytochrome c family protein